MDNILFKVLFKKGAKGSKGDSGISYEIPTGAIVAYDGLDTPEGYELTTPPEGTPSSVVDLYLSEYEDLSDNDKYNGTYYHIVPEEQIITIDIDMSSPTIVDKQAGMQYSATSNELSIRYTSGDMIGFTGYYPIDITDVTKIKYNLNLISLGYNQEKFSFSIGIRSSAPVSGFGDYHNINYTVFNHYFSDRGSIEGELDVSNYTGTYYLVIFAPSWTADLSDLQIIKGISNDEMIKVNHKTFNLEV